MKVFEEVLNKVDHPDHRETMRDVLTWISETYPEMEPVVKWNQPMFTHHGTFIIGFSMAKNHMSVSPESEGLVPFLEEIKKAGYNATKFIIRIPWNKPVDYNLLKNMIEFNLSDKADTTTFWR